MRLDFDSERQLSSQVVSFKNARMISHVKGEKNSPRISGGVYDRDGNFIDTSLCWRTDTHCVTFQPSSPEIDTEPSRHLSGNWLFGGILYQHFGHYLVESTSRLWALSLEDLKVDGVVFIPKKVLTWPNRFIRPLIPRFEFMGVSQRIEAVTALTEIENLYLAPQGFGLGEMIKGAPEYRSFIRNRFGPSVAPEGAGKLYISRTQLFKKRGRYLAEELLEQYLVDEGYEIFHPQSHSLDEQIARYKAADFILSSDNSALHLVACVAGSDAKIGVIKRRAAKIADTIVEQLDSFTGAKTRVFDALMPGRYHVGNRRNANEAYTLLDFKSLSEQLSASNFITGGTTWKNPSDKLIQAELETISKGYEEDLSFVQ